MAGSTPNWPALQDAIAGEVALPDSPAYGVGSKPYNARFHQLRPQAIVLCATPQDVSETISFVARHGLENVTRSGGHCFAGRSSTHGVVIDVTPMRSVSVEGGIASVGAGARLGDIYEALQEHGLALPAGTCPTVGIAGLALGGGLGILGRKHGLTCDRLVRAQIVLADGRILAADENEHDDLFWALRGAGPGNFGVVTSLAFSTVPAPDVTNFHLTWPYAQAIAVIEAWLGWGPNGPDELYGSLKVTTTDDVNWPPSVDVYGAFIGSEPKATEVLDRLVVRVGSEPISASVKLMSFAETREFWAQLPTADDSPPAAAAEHVCFFSKSEFFRRPLPAEAIAAVVETFTQDRAPGEARELDFMPWGGAYNRVPTAATAFAHRQELFQLMHATVVDPQASTTAQQAAQRHVVRSWASVHPWASGRVFPNFPDPDLDDWADAYYGPNYDRLLQVKARYDPGGFFRSRQSLPVP